MSSPSIHTTAGNFTRETISEVRKALEAAKAEGMDRSQTIMFDGQELNIAFGWYLVEYVEMELAKRNTGGL